MFEHLEPEASDNQEAHQGTGFLPLPPRSEAINKGTRSLNPEKVLHMLYGSLAAIDRTIKILHALGCADPNDWSDPIPTEKPDQWVVVLTKTLLMESRPT